MLWRADPLFESPAEMTVENVLWFLDLFDELEITVWLDGGWGVDALLGEQTRSHADLDIMVSAEDSAKLVETLIQHGFEDVVTDDQRATNFVMGHRQRGQIDFHVFELLPDGSGVYEPGTTDWRISRDELSGYGEIDGRRVRCLSAEYQVRSHAGYELQETDFADMDALQRKFGLALLPGQARSG